MQHSQESQMSPTNPSRHQSLTNAIRSSLIFSILQKSQHFFRSRVRFGIFALLGTLVFLASGCTSVTIDHYRETSARHTKMENNDTVVVLGRRTASDYETEVDLISCVGSELGGGSNGVSVIGESEFMDALYPWFEPRFAPVHVDALKRISRREDISKALEEYNIRYIVWIDGKTETTNGAGSLSCAITPGGAGCFGFGTFDRESDYEATIWDYDSQELLGKISADATGTSYIPAVVVPIPLIARVQSNACKGMAVQLKDFFSPKSQLTQNN
jgi:hypothetical protein